MLYDKDHRDIEMSVIGMGLSDYGVAMKIATLPDNAFFYEDTKRIHQAFKTLTQKGQHPDILSLSEQLSDDDMGVVVQASAKGYTTVPYQQYESILLDHMRRRMIRQSCELALSKVDDTTIPAEDIATECMNRMQDSYDDGSDESMEDAVLGLIDEISNAHKDRIYTGISGFDQLTGGLKGGKLVIIGARPGVGKTALALHIASNVAKSGGRVLFASLEMDSKEIASRLVGAETGVDVQRIESADLSEQEWVTVSEGYGRVGKLPIIVNTRLRTPIRLRQKASTLANSKEGLNLIVIDYIQLLSDDGNAKSRYEAVSNISRSLKLLAMDLGIPVIALTQFNRTSEAGQDGRSKKRRPSMAEAKDSGSIEQDANIFITQYAPDEPERGYILDAYNKCKRNGTELQILTIEKNRQGKTGFVAVEFDKPHMTFKTINNDTGRAWY